MYILNVNGTRIQHLKYKSIDKLYTTIIATTRKVCNIIYTSGKLCVFFFLFLNDAAGGAGRSVKWGWNPMLNVKDINN